MNAVTRESGGEEHFMEVQQHVFEDELAKEHVPESQVFDFIISHAPFFRYFATHLPETLSDVWSEADTDEEARSKIESKYEELRKELDRIFGTMFDADTQTALTEAAEVGDNETFAKILEYHLNAGRPREE